MCIKVFVYALPTLSAFFRLCLAQFQAEEFYYEAPKWPINDPSITIGTVRPYFPFGDEEISFSSGAALTAFCQINFINKGLEGPTIKGKLNFQVYDSIFPNQTIQYYTMKLLERSLYNLSTKEPLLAGNNSEKLGILLHSSAFGNARAGYAITSFYAIPYLDYGTMGGNGFENARLPTSKFSNTVLYSSRLTQNFSIANAVFDVLNYYNWTLVASIFEQSAYGSYMLSIVQSMPEDSNTDFVCIKQTNSARLSPNSSFIPNFCSCVRSYNKIGVIVVWGQINYANRVAASIKTQCSGFENTMFVVADDSDILLPSALVKFSLQNSLWINSDSPSEYTEYLKRCLDMVSEDNDKAAENLLQNLIDSYLELTRGCTFYDAFGKGSKLPCSASDVTDEFKKDLIGSEFFFVADIITAVAEAIYLLQNNCSFLTEQFKIYFADIPDATKIFLNSIGVNTAIQFCELETFTPTIITIVMRFVKFIGYTGPVSFDHKTLFREVKPYYVFNIRTSFLDNQRVGVISPDVFVLNTSDIIFPNNNATPVSEIVIDGPNLSDAVVDVFFGIFVFLCISFTIITVAYIYYRNEPHIRRNSPLLSIILFTGCILMTVGVIIASVDTTDATCIVSKCISYTGLPMLFGALVAKNYRIYRIFHNSRAAPVVIPEWKLLLLIGVYWLYFMFLISMVVVTGYGAVVRTSESNPYYKYVTCVIPSSFWDIFFAIVLIASEAVIIVSACIFAFFNRKVSAHYSESRQIAMTTYTVVAFDIVLMPLYYMMGDNTDSETLKFVIQSIAITIDLGAVLCILGLPNLYRVYRDRKRLNRAQREE